MRNGKYTIRKFKKILREGTSEDIKMYIKKKQDPWFENILCFINDIESLKLYDEKIGLSTVNPKFHFLILSNARYEKGVFLIEKGFSPYMQHKDLGNLLNTVTDFHFFKYLLEVQKLKIEPELFFIMQGKIKFIKYILDKGFPIHEVNEIRSIRHLKLFEKHGLTFSKDCYKWVQGEEEINYLYDIASEEDKSFFIKNRHITPYIIDKICKESETLTKELNVYLKDVGWMVISAKTLAFAHSKGMVDIYRGDRHYNILSHHHNIRDIKYLLRHLSSDERKKLLNEKNEAGESFLWGAQCIRNLSIKDIEYLISEGLDFSFLNDKGESFLEKTMVHITVKQFFIDKGAPIPDIKKTCTMDTYGQELGTLEEYTEYVLKNKCMFCPKLFKMFLDFDPGFKSIKVLIENDTARIRERFLKNYKTISYISNKKIIRYLIKLLPSVNTPDKKGNYLIYNFDPVYIDEFLKAGMSLDLIPDSKKEIEKRVSEDYAQEFFEAIIKKKLGKQNRELKSLITDSEDSEKVKRRI